MHPAPSIIAFTVASGAGYGLLALAITAAILGASDDFDIDLLAQPALKLVTRGRFIIRDEHAHHDDGSGNVTFAVTPCFARKFLVSPTASVAMRLPAHSA